MKLNISKSLIYLLLMVFGAATLSGVVFGGTQKYTYPDLRGTWVSTGKVTPTVKLTIGSLLGSVVDSSDKAKTHNFYSGEIVCTAITGGKVTISKSDQRHGIDIMQRNGNVNIKVMAGDFNSMVNIMGALVGKELQVGVSIGNPMKPVYQTANNGADIFIRQ